MLLTCSRTLRPWWSYTWQLDVVQRTLSDQLDAGLSAINASATADMLAIGAEAAQYIFFMKRGPLV